MLIKIEEIFGSDLPLLVKLHKIWSVDSHVNHRNCCYQLLDFKGKMHQIRFSAPDPAGGAHSAPQTP